MVSGSVSGNVKRLSVIKWASGSHSELIAPPDCGGSAAGGQGGVGVQKGVGTDRRDTTPLCHAGGIVVFQGRSRHHAITYLFTIASPVGPWRALQGPEGEKPMPARGGRFELEQVGATAVWCDSLGRRGWVRRLRTQRSTRSRRGRVPGVAGMSKLLGGRSVLVPIVRGG